MADSKTDKRPVRKLTVKNFSVIEEAELDFGKITVLIGPQASGKSLLCKLAYFFGRIALELAIDHVTRLNEFIDFRTAVEREFAKWFPEEGWGQSNWSVEFTSDRYNVMICERATTELSSTPSVKFTDEFENTYTTRVRESIEDQGRRGFVLAPALQSIAATKFMKIAGRGVWDAATYIPLERSFFVDTQTGYRALSVESEPVLAKFAIAFADSLNRDIPKRRVNAFLHGDVTQLRDGLSISFPDGRVLPFNFLSSGSKEVLPILSVLDLYEFRRRSSGPNWLGQELYGDTLYEFDELTIEEPEASVFPATQYDLVREFAALCNETDFRPSFTITTHSPYILSSFNNLIEAGQAARNHPELHDQIARIIPEQYWVKDGDFKAYSIHDGKLESILNESGFVEGNYLDQVSETITDEFDRLIKLEYDHAKAS